MKHELSFYWNLVLTKLSEYPNGIDQDVFAEIIADKNGKTRLQSVLDEMWFSNHDYYTSTVIIGNKKLLKITSEGIEAINENI